MPSNKMVHKRVIKRLKVRSSSDPRDDHQCIFSDTHPRHCVHGVGSTQQRSVTYFPYWPMRWTLVFSEYAVCSTECWSTNDSISTAYARSTNTFCLSARQWLPHSLCLCSGDVGLSMMAEEIIDSTKLGWIYSCDSFLLRKIEICVKGAINLHF